MTTETIIERAERTVDYYKAFTANSAVDVLSVRLSAVSALIEVALSCDDLNQMRETFEACIKFCEPMEAGK